MGLCRDIDDECVRARDVRTGKQLWNCDAPGCRNQRVPWGKSWKWLGSWNEWDDDPFSVFSVCSDKCQKALEDAMTIPRPKT